MRLLEFDQVAVEHLFEKFDDVLLDDAGRRFVGSAEGCYEWGELGRIGQQTPDIGAGLTKAEALAGIEGHEDDLGADGGFDGLGAARDRDLPIDSHSLET